MGFSLWKQVKKRLRRHRRPLWMLGSFVVAVIMGCCLLQSPTAVYASGDTHDEEQNTMIRTLQEQEEPLLVKVHRIYVCGEEIQPLGHMMPQQIIDLLHEHPGWTAMLDSGQKSVVLQERIDDLSSHCKSNAYIGVDKNDNLSLFEGKPVEEKVLRTFFQLDIRYMESSLPQDKLEQLANGIRIKDIDEYNSVLSTFADYAIERNEKAMKQSY